jgi:YVTN family beta-propeller protein
MRPRHSNLPRNRDWKAAEVLRLLFICLLAVSAGSISLNAQIQTLAYVTNDSGPPGGGTVSVIDTATNSVVGSPIAVEASSPIAIAITPDGTRAYVANFDSNSVSVINTATNTLIGAPIAVGTRPRGVAITPDGTHAYVANSQSRTVSVIDIATNTVVGSPIALGAYTPNNLAITPNGTRAYLTCGCGDGVAVIDSLTNTEIGVVPIPASLPYSVAITPDGTRAYVTTIGGSVNAVYVIDTATNTVSGAAIPLPGEFGAAVAITPDGTRAYVAVGSPTFSAVSVIDTVTNSVLGSPITVGKDPLGLAITPDGTRAYVTNFTSNTVSVIDIATNTLLGSPIVVGMNPEGIAIAKVCSSPTISAVGANPNVIWPPNHEMIPVTVSGSTSGGCGAVSCKIIAVSSNEPIDSGGDWIITGNLTLELEADRLGSGSGRVYTVTVQCTDASGNSVTKTTIVTVPHDQR